MAVTIPKQVLRAMCPAVVYNSGVDVLFFSGVNNCPTPLLVAV